ncbi:MAG: RNA 3'-terminal phosphate cyclase [Candidatus Tectimicrobiota bacterium]
MAMLTIDGSYGEGGGQILRTALALALVTGTPFCLERIRAGRAKPGLLRQHLTAVQAAATIGQAEVRGATLGSGRLTFVPGPVTPGSYTFAIGSAGSTTLVLQTVLPALLLAAAPSTLCLEGGTHNPFAPPFDFLEQTFFPLLRRMGASVQAQLERPGFYPAGGGKWQVTINPAARLSRLDMLERGAVRNIQARALVAHLPHHIAERELAVVRQHLNWSGDWLHVESVPNGPGNIVLIAIETAHLVEIFSGFGARGVPAETVASQAVAAAQRYLAAEVVVDEYLADQLLLPLALARGGSFTSLTPSRHTTTNMYIIQHFLDLHMHVEPRSETACQITISA